MREVENRVPQAYFINDFNGEEFVVTFYEKELQTINQKEFRIENVIEGKGDNYMSNRRAMIVHLIAGLTKKTSQNKCDFIE